LFKIQNEFKVMKIMNKIILVLGVSGMATAALADEGISPTNQAAMALTSQQFVQDAMACGMKEVRLGEIALGKTQNTDVKQFAERMVKDHAKANEKLMKIANDEGLSIPATNMFSADDPNWSNPLITNPAGLKGDQLLTMTNLPYLADYQAIHQLQPFSGNQFDQSYAAEMVGDHTNAINEFNAASQGLSDKKLSRFARKTLPTLRKHYDMAEELANKLDVKMNTNSAGTNSTAP
jgi:putative membrane protein